MISTSVPLRSVWAEINLDNLVHNIKEFKKHLGEETELMAVVKADAYGHGAYEVSKVALESGASWLGVAILEEGILLRHQGIEAPILILGYTPPHNLELCFDYDLIPTLFTYEAAKVLSEMAVKKGKDINVHIKVDTGMGRVGIRPEKCLEFLEYVKSLPGVVVEGLYTHFSVADEKDKSYTKKQYSAFQEVLYVLENNGIEVPYKHACNSAAAIDLPGMHLDLARVGISMYGSYTSPHVSREVQIKPLMSLKARVSYVKKVPPGTSISYGRKYITKKESVIATVPLGYGDGYTRLLSNKGSVLYNGKRLPIIGSVCMDQFMVLADKAPEIKIGDEVVLIGSSEEEEITADELADIVGTISYEIYCMIDKRIPRLYYKNGELIKTKSLLSV